MGEVIEKAAKGAEMTARGTAATGRAVVPVIIIGLLIASGLIPVLMMAEMVQGEPNTDMQFIGMMLAMGLAAVATAVAWGAAAIAVAIHFAGRHLGRPNKTD